MEKTKNIEIAPHMPWLAPLAGWSDLAFRLLCREEGAFVACTEMISSKGLVYGGKNTEDLLATTAEDTPLVVQIFGAEHEFMEKSIAILQNRGFYNFDINVGCSVAKVVKTGAGAAMLRDVSNLLFVAERVILQKQAFANKGKIGFKLRLGYELGNDVYREVSKELEKLGADWITLHPRYAKQAFHGVPHYNALAYLKEDLHIPVIASGDLFSAVDGVRVLKETGVDAVMYARGAMANPRIFADHKILWEYVQEHKIINNFEKYTHMLFQKSEETMRKDLANLIRRHLAYAKKFNPQRTLLQMRTIVPRYVKHLENAKTLRLALIGCKSFEKLEEILEQTL